MRMSERGWRFGPFMAMPIFGQWFAIVQSCCVRLFGHSKSQQLRVCDEWLFFVNI